MYRTGSDRARSMWVWGQAGVVVVLAAFAAGTARGQIRTPTIPAPPKIPNPPVKMPAVPGVNEAQR